MSMLTSMDLLSYMSLDVKYKLVIVPEQILVLFWAGPTSLRSGRGTFFVPESDHAKHFR